MIVRPETPTYLLDAELCARLCRTTWREQVLWDTVTIKRYPQAAWMDGFYDEVVISGQVQELRRGPRP